MLGILRPHEVAAEVIADLPRLEIIVLLGLLMIVVGEDLWPDASHRARVALTECVVRSEGELRTLRERDLERMVALGLTAEGARDTTKEEVEVQGLVTLVDNDEVGIFRYTVEEETVVDDRLHARLDAEGLQQLPQCLQIERLSAAAVTLILVLAHGGVETECCPGGRFRLVAVKQIADVDQLGQQTAVLLAALFVGECLFVLVGLAPIESRGVDDELEELARLVVGNGYLEVAALILRYLEHRRHVAVVMIDDGVFPDIAVAEAGVGVTSDALGRHFHPAVAEEEAL